MFSDHIQNLVLFSYPEAIVYMYMALILMGAKMDWKKLVISAVFLGTTGYIVKFFFGYVYINIFLSALYMTAALSFFKISSLYERFISSIIASGLYSSIEFLYLTFLFSILQIPYETIQSNVGIKFLCFLPQLFAVVSIAYLLRRFKISVFS